MSYLDHLKGLKDSCDEDPYSSTQELHAVVNSYISRKFTEELDLVEIRGGDSYIENGLQTNFKKGISEDSLLERISAFGDNKRHAKLAKSLLSHIKEACDDVLIRILILVCVGMLLVHLVFDRENIQTAILDSMSIIIAVVLCVTVGSFNNYQKEKQYLSLYQVSENNKNVLVHRGGKLVTLRNNEVVVGDVVVITEGMEIPADGWVVQSHDIKADESHVTGENDSLAKEPYERALRIREQARESNDLTSFREIPSPILLSGSKILSGSGKFVVLQVGQRSSLGCLGDMIIGENDPTPLQLKLNQVAESIGTYGTVAAISIVVVLFLKFAWNRYTEGDFNPQIHSGELIGYILIGLSTAVASIPEGLPLAVTIALAYSAKKMLKDNNLVRKLDACETMGGADSICSDKTGTLTQNKMAVDSIYIPSLFSSDTVNARETHFEKLIPHALVNIMAVNFCCNNNANLAPLSGSKTNVALLELLKDKGVDIRGLRRKYRESASKIFEFSSTRKRSGIIVNLNGPVLLEKGAAELIVASCSRMHLGNGKIIELDEHQKERLYEIVETMSSKALRVLAFAYKKVEPDADLETKDHHDIYAIEKSGLIFTGFVGIRDTLREGVPETIQKCKTAGIKVRMITGDNRITAREIAYECGILNSNSLIMEGEEFMATVGGVVCKSCQTAECGCPRTKAQAQEQNREVRVDTIGIPEEFNRIYKNLDVLARARPLDKYALVVGLKERGYVVAVTGDGANDAPALIKADVGFAMGKSGTEITKESSDIVIMDDNFESIVKAVVWGRNVYDNIQKFLQFQLTINVTAVLLIMIGSAVLSSPVFTPVQLLWINLVMDTLASLALAAEDPDDRVLTRLPHKRSDKIISSIMTKHIIGQSLYQIIVLCAIIFYGDHFIPEDLPDVKGMDGKSLIYNEGTGFIRSGRLKFPFSLQDDYHPNEIKYGPSRHFTIVFNTFVFLQVFGFFAARKIDDSLNIFRGVHKSSLFLVIVTFVAVVQWVFVELGGHVVSCSSDGLSRTQWLICLGFAAGGLVVNFGLKFLPNCAFSLQLEKTKEEANSDTDSTGLSDEKVPLKYESDL